MEFDEASVWFTMTLWPCRDSPRPTWGQDLVLVYGWGGAVWLRSKHRMMLQLGSLKANER